MNTTKEKQLFAKPFLKWAGGKTQILDEIDKRLPKNEIYAGDIDTYIEPFLGGGAVFFHIAYKYPEFKKYFLFDINQDIVNCFNSIKQNVDKVIKELQKLSHGFFALQKSDRRDFYYNIREQFNRDRSPAKLIFLNRTCYNGLYRVNRKGNFNVPFGDYKNPLICDNQNIKAVSHILKDAEIICADFEDSKDQINSNTFVYLDPPYRPISQTSSFTSYAQNDFSEHDQLRLTKFCKIIDAKGAKFLLSNSDPKNENPNENFFEEHYSAFIIERVKATRAINCRADRRGQINELLITNYSTS
jgi:DNA adenine methylase